MSDRFTHSLLHPEKISDLMAKHGDNVAILLTKARTYVDAHPEVAEAAKQAPLDEIFVLRFLLSASRNEIEAALKNIIETLDYRAKSIEDLVNAKNDKVKYHDTIMKHMHAAFIGYLGGLHPVMVVRVGRSRPKNVLAELGPDKLLEGNMLWTEQLFCKCDTKTRETGLLCKSIQVIDLEGFSIFNFDTRVPRIIGKASSLSAVYYPQMLGKKIIMNMPVTFRVFFRAITALSPPSAREKQAVCPANTTKGSAADCPFLQKFTNGTTLVPPFLGGTGPMLPEFVLKDKDRELSKDEQ